MVHRLEQIELAELWSPDSLQAALEERAHALRHRRHSGRALDRVAIEIDNKRRG